jgi:beta-glucosidase
MELGLFEDPYKFSDKERERQQWNDTAHLRAARIMAEKSMVLLKNENGLLPLSRQTKTIAFIGPLVKAVRDNLGFWSYEWPDDSMRIVSQWQGALNKTGSAIRWLYAKGCEIRDTSSRGFAEAVAVASQADVVILSVGESGDMSGEAKSRSDIHLPGVQEELIKAIQATGKPLVVLINAGRPLIFPWTAGHVPAILYTWWLGTEAGDAIADVLFGDYNPSGKLPMSFPRTEGQIPVYYDHFSTGRPPDNDSEAFYRSGYIDLPNSPQYPFGFGLSYTRFVYSALHVNKTSIRPGEALEVSVTLANTGNYDGEETVQLYIRDLVASVTRPVKELKAFKKVFLKKGESREVRFTLTTEDLKFYDRNLRRIAEPGEFSVFAGGNSRDLQEASFTLYLPHARH